MHEDEEERRFRDEEPLGKAIFLGQECKLQRRKVRFKKTRKTYDIKERQLQKEVDMECHSGSGNRASKSRQKPIVFTNEFQKERAAEIKEEEKAARKRSLKLYMEVSGWLRKEACTDHSKLAKWIAKKVP